MAGIDDLNYDLQEDYYDEYQNQEEQSEFERADDNDPDFLDNNTEDEENDSSTALEDFLKSKGISDIHSIKFEGDNGNIEDVDWDNLSKEEQLNILSQDNTDPDTSLDDSEIDLINRIRLSGMSVEDYLALERQKGVSQYASQQQPQEYQYTVDDISDDELFMLDLQTKIDDISDEELMNALENAKANSTLYEKQIQGLRNEYKRLEDERNEREQAIAQQESQERFQAFSNNIMNSIRGFNSIGDLDVSMEQADAEELAQFILGNDPAGVNYFAKALNDPDTLVRLAWFALHGEDVINSISDYYRNAITQSSRSNYEKGYNDARNGKSNVVIAPKKNVTRRVVKSVDDINY